MIKRWLKRLTIAGLIVCVLGGLVMIGGEIWVRAGADGHVYSETAVPAAPVALVLGAQVYADGTPSAYLAARLDLAKRLLDTGKVKAILLSGDHRSWDYDEPGSMEVYLLTHGVPARQIVLDYAGFDTYDSCARAKRIFGVRRAIVVTQSFHVDRAVALCRHLGVDATGVGDESVKHMRAIWTRNLIRERGATVKAVYDVVSGRDPALLGRQETGIQDALRAS